MDKNLKNWQKFLKPYGYNIVKRTTMFWKVFVVICYLTIFTTIFYLGHYFTENGLFENNINTTFENEVLVQNTYDFKPNNVVDNDYQFNPNYTIINEIEINCENWSNA